MEPATLSIAYKTKGIKALDRSSGNRTQLLHVMSVFANRRLTALFIFLLTLIEELALLDNSLSEFGKSVDHGIQLIKSIGS